MSTVLAMLSNHSTSCESAVKQCFIFFASSMLANILYEVIKTKLKLSSIKTRELDSRLQGSFLATVPLSSDEKRNLHGPVFFLLPLILKVSGESSWSGVGQFSFSMVPKPANWFIQLSGLVLPSGLCEFL